MRLEPEQLEQLADAIAERLRTPQPPATPASPNPPLVDAATLARQLGVNRGFVYHHSAELGAIRLGKGEKAPVRFDPVAALDAMSRLSGKQSEAGIPNNGGQSQQQRSGGQRRLPSRQPKLGHVLAIRGRSTESDRSGAAEGSSKTQDLEAAA
jgi:hypothetical protein